ncbi:bacteriocin [Campylobacter sp. MIT 12-8780]|uniref:bacteriocin n=1 Tax=unclassified Campylobacter TaxID=2593542 RepID=UPI00115DE888|nr:MULTISPECIES: bacteriocin [unclassified Campylobacter]NDJ28177.1 bacteriocin [Campylobacter sp. MIT 19-121]TQR40579.1 bacteriocin [Campylobacter sp. MIT 12-8780]
MKKFFFFCLALVLANSAFSDDFLARVSKGNLSDYSVGVKKLSLEEMKEVKGGYQVVFLHNGSQWNPADEVYAIAKYTQGELQYMANYLQGNTSAPQGLCGIDQTSCSNPSKNRFTAFLQITQKSLSMLPVYTVKRQVKVSNMGKPYVVFTYGVGAYDTQGKQMYKFNSSLMLNNNMIIKEMANKYKEQMESALGGWYAR